MKLHIDQQRGATTTALITSFPHGHLQHERSRLPSESGLGIPRLAKFVNVSGTAFRNQKKKS